MSTDKLQSAINETRDQLSLDYADDKYLNIVTANLGLVRPPFGFNDTTWRAIGRALALRFKQIANKFRDVLEVMFGPQVTQAGTLSQAADVGDTSVFLNASSQFPQLGTFILDEGIVGTQETVSYCFINRNTHEVFLDTPLVNAHAAFATDAEQPVSFDLPVGVTSLFLPNSYAFPEAGFPYPVVVGRGTSSEEVLVVSANDIDTGILTVGASTNAHEGLKPTTIQTDLALAYASTASYLTLDESKQFPKTGVVLLSPVGDLTGAVFVASAGALTTVTVAASAFTTDVQVGNVVVFSGNVTAALAGVEAQVIANTDVQLTFLSNLPAPPLAGDEFYLRPRVEYVNNDYDQNSLLIREEIRDVFVPSGVQVELLENNATVTLAPVKFAGQGWDVIQSDPRHVEILLPAALNDTNTIRSASYLHPEYLAPLATTVSVGAAAGDTFILPANATAFPNTGVITINSGLPTEERLGYKIPNSFLQGDIAAAATTLVVADSSELGGVGDQIIVDVEGTPEIRPIVTNDTSTGIITVAALAAAHLDGAIVYANKMVLATGVLANPHPALQPIALYEPRYGVTELLDGDLWGTPDVYPGPYVYDLVSDCILHTSTALTTLDGTYAGPTSLASSSLLGETALEVFDASAFPLSGFPYSVLVGEGTGNRETVVVNAVNLMIVGAERE